MSWTHPTFEAIARDVSNRTGLSFLLKRTESAEIGMRRAMTLAKVTDPDEYFARIRSDATALDDLISELTVGETYFFREPAQFDFIRHEVLPEIRRRRSDEHVVRAWSAGCSSGEEICSLAILFEQEGLGEQAFLLGTDISRAVLSRAIRGTYGEWSLRGEGAAQVRPWLDRQGDKLFRLREKIRQRITFEYLNLSLDAYPSFATQTWGMDLILCRNVLIYFDEVTVRNVARRLFESLSPGGWLITASTDPAFSDADIPFETVQTPIGLFYRRSVIPGVLPEGSRTDQVASNPPTAKPVAVSAATARLDGPSQSEQTTLMNAQRALARGDHAAVVRLTQNLSNNVEAAVLHVRALAGIEPAEAELASARAVRQHPLSEELQYLRAVLLIDLNQPEEAARVLRRVIYLDRTLAIAHFTLGSVLMHGGDADGARRAYRNAHDLCAKRLADEVLPLADGECAGRLAKAASAQIAILEGSGKVTS